MNRLDHAPEPRIAERFKNVVGDTPLEYLTRWRMQRAAGLLESGDAPVKEVVAASGYASEAAFRTAFKKWHRRKRDDAVAEMMARMWDQWYRLLLRGKDQIGRAHV